MYCLQTLLGLCRDFGCRGGAGFKRKLILAARHVAVGLIRGLGRDGDGLTLWGLTTYKNKCFNARKSRKRQYRKC